MLDCASNCVLAYTTGRANGLCHLVARDLLVVLVPGVFPKAISDMPSLKAISLEDNQFAQ